MEGCSFAISLVDLVIVLFDVAPAKKWKFEILGIHESTVSSNLLFHSQLVPIPHENTSQYFCMTKQPRKQTTAKSDADSIHDIF